ncbi:GNAT family N-acetyltransferase [Dyella sp. A6]|uniref:GNAT family N-acetyltransferase n=1 Tax=Dyella aluminiiresistens TaxID=3069105 RepID=UPI002E793F04|nr:GNAT family N-acetyltransferase [Dyella sp. A6]
MSWQDIRIETERLILRPPQADDFAGWSAFFADPDATRHMGGPRSEPLAWRHFLMMVGAWSIEAGSAFSLVDKHSGQWLGWTGPWHPVGWPGTEVGWCLARSAWGQGYATEAATAVLDWVFEHLSWDQVIHLITPDNQASQAVARRLGAAVLRRIDMPEPFAGETVDVWGQSREAWQRRRP